MTASRPGLLFVGNFLSKSRGRSTVCDALSTRLRAAGWNVLTTSTRERKLERLADMVTTAWRRRRDYEVAHIDVFSGHAFLWAEAVAAVCRRAGKPYVLTLHGGLLPEFAARHPGRVRRLLSRASAVTAPSRFLQQHMAPYWDGLLLHPNPIEIGQYRFRWREQPQPNLLWVRAFHSVYQPELAVHVVERLRRVFPNARLTMVGPDKGDGSFARTAGLARASQLDAAVQFTGGVPPARVAEELERHDVFLNTTTVDNTPVSLLEALAAGLPAVTTNAGGIPYLVRHDHDALIVPIGDADAMCRAVERVLTERGLAARLSSAARRTAESFDWPCVLPLWERLFCRLDPRRDARGAVDASVGTRRSVPARR